MMGFFRRDPVKALQKAYEKKLEQAMLAARNGDMRANASLTEEAEALRTEIEAAKTGKPDDRS